MTGKRKKNEPRDLIDLKFDAVSSQHKDLVLKRDGHPILEELRI